MTVSRETSKRTGIRLIRYRGDSRSAVVWRSSDGASWMCERKEWAATRRFLCRFEKMGEAMNHARHWVLEI